jgi:hypothetical protein
MPVQMQFAPIDFSSLGKMGQNIGEAVGDYRLKSDMAGVIGPDGTIDYDKAIAVLMRHDPMKGMALANQREEARALASYRHAQAAPSPEDELLRSWMQPQGPSYLGPVSDTAAAADAAEEAEASGTSVPGVSTYAPRDLRNAPKKVQDILAPAGDIKKWETEAVGAANRQGQRDALAEAAPNIQSIINQAFADSKGYDPKTFENALGPLQGADDPTTWQEAIGTRGAQTWGSLLNYMQHTQGQGLDSLTKPVDQIPGGLTSTVRDNVKATQATLINFLQRVQRVPGIGAQSDRELQQIVDQVGKLQNAKTVGDYHNRLTALVTRLNQSGIPIKLPEVEAIAGIEPTTKSAERYSNPPESLNARSVPTYNVDPATGSMSPTTPGVEENTMVGGVNIGRTTRQPPTPPQRALNALKAYKNNKEARAAFDEIYGPGAAEFYLQKYR